MLCFCADKKRRQSVLSCFKVNRPVNACKRNEFAGFYQLIFSKFITKIVIKYFQRFQDNKIDVACVRYLVMVTQST